MKNAAALQAGPKEGGRGRMFPLSAAGIAPPARRLHRIGKQNVNFRQEGLYFDKKRGILYDKNLYDTAARLLRLGRYNGEI